MGEGSVQPCPGDPAASGTQGQEGTNRHGSNNRVIDVYDNLPFP